MVTELVLGLAASAFARRETARTGHRPGLSLRPSRHRLVTIGDQNAQFRSNCVPPRPRLGKLRPRKIVNETGLYVVNSDLK